MIHSHYFITNKAGMPLDEFFTYWRKRHVRAVSEPVPQIRRYLQSHRIADLKSDSHYQGIAESWYDTLEDMEAMRSAPAYSKMLEDEANFIDPGRVEFLTTDDRVMLDGERRPGMIKYVVLAKRKVGMTTVEFDRHWRNAHGPLVLKMPGVSRYVQCPTVSAAYAFAEPEWDGCAHIWFDDAETAKRSVKSPEYINGAMPDAGNFIGRSAGFWSREHLVIWPK